MNAHPNQPNSPWQVRLKSLANAAASPPIEVASRSRMALASCMPPTEAVTPFKTALASCTPPSSWLGRARNRSLTANASPAYR